MDYMGCTCSEETLFVMIPSSMFHHFINEMVIHPEQCARRMQIHPQAERGSEKTPNEQTNKQTNKQINNQTTKQTNKQRNNAKKQSKETKQRTSTSTQSSEEKGTMK